MDASPDVVGDLARDVDAAVESSVEAAPTAAVAEVLTKFLRAGKIPERYRRAHPGLPVTTYMLHADAEGTFSIAVLVLRPGAKAPLHDHTTWTVWGTLEGRDRERQYERREASQEDSFPELAPISDRVLRAGEVSVVDLPPRDVHYVENVGDVPSVSVHVHGADLSRVDRNRYDPERRTVVPFVQSYDRDP